MKIIFPLIICISFSIYSQQVPTTLSEVYDEEIKFDFFQNSGSYVGEWVERQSMPYPRYYGASVMYSKNDTTWLYVFGGDTTGNGNATKAVLRYNVNVDIWEYVDSLPIPMRVNSAARLGDKLYTMGGFGGIFSDTAVRKFYEYDVNTHFWTELPELPEGIFLHKAIGYQDSLIYIIGGVRSDFTIFLNKVLLYNANTQQFREATSLPEQRANCAVVILNDTLFITGGYFNNDSLSNETFKAIIDQTDRSQLTYLELSNYPVQVHSHFGYPESNSKINFFGGSITPGFNPIDSSYSFRIPAYTYNTGGVIPVSITTFHAGYNFTPINPGVDSILTVVISGGVISGPLITGRTWVYKDTINYPIPVELISFTASVEGRNVNLKWITQSELNNRGFSIEKLSDKEVGWNEIGFVNGNGTTTEESHYLFTDKNLQEGTYKYRLKQYDFDGIFEYSSEAKADITFPEFFLSQNYPNPFNPVTTIQFAIPKESFTKLEIFNSLGEKVSTLVSENLSAGTYEYEWNANGLPSGVYLYRLSTENFVQTKKLLLMK